MKHSMLLSVKELQSLQGQQNCVIFDCRFVLDDPGAGLEMYLDSHIPGAVYAHLDDDLSSPVTPGSGRHPLPDADRFARFLARSGWAPGKLLVAYDDAGGAIAARLWWLMKYFGHDNAAMLDGGMPAWWAAGYEEETGLAHAEKQAVAQYQVREELVITTDELETALSSGDLLLADARAPERFSGEIEPIDAVAGRIPGSVNYPFNLSLDKQSRFKPVGELRSGLQGLAGNHPQEDVAHMCGSGVTACHNIFAAELAGLPVPRLYVGSWSEWIRDPSRPIRRSV